MLSSPLAQTARLAKVPQNLEGGVVTGRAGYAPSGMCARTTQIQPGNGSAVLGPTRYRAHGEKLLEREVSVENISLGKPIHALQIERCEYLPHHNGSRHVGSIFGDLLCRSRAAQFTFLIRSTAAEEGMH